MTAILWTSSYWAWVASEVAIAVATRTGKSGGKMRDRGSQLILWIVIVISVTACEWLRRIMPANMFGGAAWWKAASVAVLAAALAIRWTALFTLGKSFSANVAIRESQKMVRSGCVPGGAASFLFGFADGFCSDWNSFEEPDQLGCCGCADNGGAGLSNSGGGTSIAGGIWRGIRPVQPSNKEVGSWRVLRNQSRSALKDV